MVSVKERTVKGRTYVYVSATASFKGERKRFEKSVGSKDTDAKVLERRIEFHSWLVEQRKEAYLMYLETKNINFKYIPKVYAFPLIYVKRQYEIELRDYYPGELEKYQEAFDVRYIHHTTAIEGNTLTLSETGLVLDKGLAPARKKLREIHEVENFRNLLKFVRTYKKDISIDFILKLHELVLRNIDDDSAGSFRRAGVFITGSKYEPPPAVVVPEEMEELIKWYNNRKGKMNPLEMAGYFHCRFTQIHPFIDGNGRVGRELLNFILRKNGYPLIIIPVESREDYISSLEKANDGDYKPILVFLLEIMIEDYVKVIRNNKAKFMESFGEFRPDELKEFIEMAKWSASIMKRYIDKTPMHLKEILGKIMD